MSVIKTNGHSMLERMIFFSDAVFAIAITLLVIEIRVPEVEHSKLTDQYLWEQLAYSIPKIIGVIISFFVIGLYWISHHKLFGFVTDYSKALLWPNLIFLLTIIFMPFTTAYLSEYYNPGLTMPVVLYTINITLTGLASYRLWNVGTSKKLNISTISNHPVLKKYNKTRAIAVPAIFFIVMLLSFVSGWIPFLVLPFIPLVTYFIKRHYFKKYPALHENL